MPEKIRVLLLDGDTVQCVSAARSLREIGANVTVLCKSIISYGCFSAYPNNKIIINKQIGKEEYIQEIIKYIRNNKTDIIIPLFGDSAAIISFYKDVIEKENVKVAVPSIRQYELANNKRIFMQILEKNRIPSPKTIPAEEALKTIDANSLKYPLILKPDTSTGAKGIRIIKGVNETKKVIEESVKIYGNCSIQEYVNNDGTYYSAILYRGKNGGYDKTVVLHIKRYFPLKGGTSCFCEAVENKEIDQICKKIMDIIGWHGIANFDIVKDCDTKQYKIIEMNPRVPACVHGAYISGVNFFETIVTECMDNKIPVHNYMASKKLRYFSLDVMWLTCSKTKAILDNKWFDFNDNNVYWQEGGVKDPFPIVAGILNGIIKYSNKGFRRAKLAS